MARDILPASAYRQKPHFIFRLHFCTIVIKGHNTDSIQGNQAAPGLFIGQASVFYADGSQTALYIMDIEYFFFPARNLTERSVIKYL